MSLDQLCAPRKISCTTFSTDILPARQFSRPPTRCSVPSPGFRDQTLNNSEGRSFHPRSTPMPELNQTSFISQPQTLSKHVLCGTLLPNMKGVFSTKKACCSASAASRRSLQRGNSLVASHSWSGTMNDGLLGGLIPEDHPNLLRFERMSLTSCPAINPDDGCHLLSLQRNRITRIDHLHRLTQLVFLDLSHNQMSHISGLDQLTVLRVLLLGHNHIRQIRGLENQQRLEVLDLQQNGIRKIENLSHLINLRVLNLAVNSIVFVSGLSGMVSLTEVNLRQNNIVQIEPLSNLPNLLWVHLSFNNIERWSQISGLSGVSAMAKVILDGNPIVMDPSYRRLMPNRCSANTDRYVQRNTMHGSVKHTSSQQRSLGLVNAGAPGTDVYELSQIKLQIPDVEDNTLHSGSWHTLSSEVDKPDQVAMNERPDLHAGDQPIVQTGSTRSPTNVDTALSSQSTFTTVMSSNVRTTNDHEDCTNIDALCSQPISCLEQLHFKTMAPNTVTTTATHVTTDENLLTASNSIDSHETLTTSSFTNTVDRRIMTDQSFLCSQAAVRPMQSIQWVIGDRTHIYLECKSWSDEVCAGPKTDMTGFSSLVAALNDLAMSSKTGDRALSGASCVTKGTNLAYVTSLIVSHVAWEEFRNELPRIRQMFPEMKCLTLKHMGIRRLVDIVALVELKRLESLRVDPGPKNPIVRQSGQYWRPFVIWSLKEALGLQELDKMEITPDEVTAAFLLFKDLGTLLNTHALPITTAAPLWDANQQQIRDEQRPTGDSQRNLSALRTQGRRDCALSELDKATESQCGTVMNQWLKQVHHDKLKKIPQLLQRAINNACVPDTSNARSVDLDDPIPVRLSERALDCLQFAAKREPQSSLRHLTVRQFVKRTLHNTGHRLVRETQIMNAWPSILRQLIEREVQEPAKESAYKTANNNA